MDKLQGQFARILVRDARSGLYLGGDGEWVSKDEARQFASIHEAGVQAFECEEADVVLAYAEPACELVLNPVYCAPDAAAKHPRRRRI